MFYVTNEIANKLDCNKWFIGKTGYLVKVDDVEKYKFGDSIYLIKSIVDKVLCV